MRFPTWCVLALAGGLVFGGFERSVLGHPPEEAGHHRTHAGGEGARPWTNAKTGEVVVGPFLASRDGKVSIERENGDVVKFAVEDLSAADQAEAQKRIGAVKAINERLVAEAVAGRGKGEGGAGFAGPKPAQAEPFDLFAPYVKTRWDERWLYVESDGLPHAPWTYPLMVGIKSWQQQVPLPQKYTGDNAWRIPLKPELADKPISGKTQLYRGAIALAANGVPIFNALNNRGDDALKAGELDEFGGHSGRGDDYHYHIAPLGLQKVVGKEKPIAYALDGFPIFGLFDPAAKKGDEKACPMGSTEKLDELNGHFGAGEGGAKGLYHYHASTGYPYINGGVRGKVTVKDDQIDPQPRAQPIRQWLQPLRGASVTGFKALGAEGEKACSLEYTLAGKKHLVNFRMEVGGKYIFDFVDPDGTKKTETYEARPERGGGGGGGGRPPNDPARGPDDRRRPPGSGPGDRPPPPPREGEQGPKEHEPPSVLKPVPGFALTSPAVGADGKLSTEFTCDGASLSPPLAWGSKDKVPAGTKSFAVTMHHFPGPARPGDKPGEDKHVYVVLYNIPADTLSVVKGQIKAGGVGVRGINTVNRKTEYAPPCSKGPGAKKYTLTVYALSAEPNLAPAKDGAAGGVTMDTLLAAIKDKTLGTATLDVTYERPR